MFSCRNCQNSEEQLFEITLLDGYFWIMCYQSMRTFSPIYQQYKFRMQTLDFEKRSVIRCCWNTSFFSNKRFRSQSGWAHLGTGFVTYNVIRVKSDHILNLNSLLLAVFSFHRKTNFWCQISGTLYLKLDVNVLSKSHFPGIIKIIMHISRRRRQVQNVSDL